MAIQTRSLLRRWFKRGQYPTAEQFSDLFDSFLHQQEDTIPIDKVAELPEQLNGKYGMAEGTELEQQVNQLSSDFSNHKDVANERLTKLDESLAAETARATGEEAAIREELVAGDSNTLSDAKSYTDQQVAEETTRATEEEAAIREELATGDANTLSDAKDYTDQQVATETTRATEEEAAIREELATGDANTLSDAKSYTDQQVAAETTRATGEETTIREELATGDTNTLSDAKDYTDQQVAEETARATGEEAAIRKELAAGDANTLSDAKGYTDQQVAAETTRATEEEAAIRKELAVGDNNTLSSAKAYTDQQVTEEATRAKGEETTIREELAAGDTNTLSNAKDYTDQQVAAETTRATGEEAAIRKELAAGDNDTLSNAKAYTDQQVADEATRAKGEEAAIRQELTDGDTHTLAAANNFTTAAIADLVDNSPAALNTLKELATALGDDPNFATTVATQIGQKVDKVTGKGLSTEDYTTDEKSKLAGIEGGANKYTHPESHPADMITEDALHRFVTDTEKSTWNAKASKTVATTSANGLMSAADKKKLDNIEEGASKYTHPESHPADMITEDASHRFVTDTEKSTWNAKASKAVATTSANGLMSAADKKKLDGIEEGANKYTHPESHPADMITEDESHRFITDEEREAWNSKATGTMASPTTNGLMSAADKKKLDGIEEGANKYTHPESHPADMIEEDELHQFVTANEKAKWDAKASTTVVTQITDGLMPADDKKKLDGIEEGANKYTHPKSHPADMIEEDELHQFVTADEKAKWDAKASTAVATTSDNGLMSAADKTKLDALQQSLTVKSDSTTLVVYDGSAAKTVNISPKNIGAQPSKGWPQTGVTPRTLYLKWGLECTATVYVPEVGQDELSTSRLYFSSHAIGTPVFVLNFNPKISTATSNLIIETSHSATQGSGTKVFDYKAGLNLCGCVLFTEKKSGTALQITGFMFYPSDVQYYIAYCE